jgi:ABC-type Fe3+/spermidine/putrescine transport system ATPase subunit
VKVRAGAMEHDAALYDAFNVESLSFAYGTSRVLSTLSFTIKRNEFFSLLGPSGCGKSTMLALLSGQLSPSSGRICLGKGLFQEGSQRNIVTVFQDRLLFPHLNIADNVGFGLRVRGMPTAGIKAKIQTVCEMLGIRELLARFPHEVSGGQAQRVALARALVVDPQVILLDEPLTGLDRALRAELRGLLGELRKRISATMVFVTHDYEEALALSDALLLLTHDGRLSQTGSPEELYYHPTSQFCARYFGMANIFEIHEVKRTGNEISVGILGGVKLMASDHTSRQQKWVGFHAKHVKLTPRSDNVLESNVLVGRLASKTFEGRLYRNEIVTDEGVTIVSETSVELDLAPGDLVKCFVEPQNIILF